MQKDLSFSNLLVLFLKKSKTILVTILVFAVLIGGFGALNASKGVSESAKEAALETYKEKKDQYEKEYSSIQAQLTALENDKEELNAYLSNSIYFNLENSNVSTKEILFYVGDSSMTSDEIKAIASVYKTAYKNNEFYAELSSVLGKETEAQYLNELVSIRIISEGVLEIRAQYSDEATASALADTTFSFMQEKVTSAIGQHPVSIMSSSVHTGADQDLLEYQNSQEEARDKLDVSILEQTTALEKKENEQPAEPDFSTTGVVKKTITYTILGAVIGLVLSLLWLVLSYMASSRLDSVQDWDKHYKIPVLAVSLEQSGKRVWFKKATAHLQGLSEKEIPYEEAIRLTDVNLIHLVKEHPANIFVTGTLPEETLKKAAASLSSCDSEKLTYKAGACILSSSASVTETAQASGVLLVEKRGYSDHKMLEREISRLEQLEMSIVGVLLL